MKSKHRLTELFAKLFLSLETHKRIHQHTNPACAVSSLGRKHHGIFVAIIIDVSIVILIIVVPGDVSITIVVVYNSFLFR